MYMHFVFHTKTIELLI